MKPVYPVISINEAVNHLFVPGPLKHQEDSNKKTSSRMVLNRKLEENASYFTKSLHKCWDCLEDFRVHMQTLLVRTKRDLRA